MHSHSSLLDILGPVQRCNTHSAIIYHNVSSKKIITYAELFEASERLSATIHSLSRDVNPVVAISIVELHCLVPLAILGILKASGTFLYLDSTLERQEQESILHAAKCSVLISDHQHGFNNWSDSTSLMLTANNYLLLSSARKSEKQCVLNVSNTWEEAYIVRTSGSTGQPKLVHVPHSCILPNILDFRLQFQMKEDDVILGCSPFTFDPSVIDILLAFSSGATLVLVEPSLKSVPAKLIDIIEKEHVTILQATPSLLLLIGPQLSRDRLLSEKTSLRILALGGEPFPSPRILCDFSSPKNTTTIYNLYGITEVSCWATVSLYDKRSEKVDLGRPLEGTQLRVMNDEGEEIKEGNGLLWIGGSRVCLLNDEKPEDIRLPAFRNTGDMVKYENGKLYYLGRTDDMTKRLGQRLNLHSVENTALESGMTSQCCVFLDRNQRLILACKDLLSADTLKNYLKRNSPALEQPNEVIQIEHFPLSKHGKIDRKKLLELYEEKEIKKGGKADWKTLLMEGWKEATGKEMVVDANFIMSGGNSLSAIELANRIQDKVGISFPCLLDILINRTSSEVVDYLCEEAKIDGHAPESRIHIYNKHLPFHNVKLATNVIDVSLLWKFRLNKCIDASPLVIDRSDNAAVYIGSHSHLFSCMKLDSGGKLWTTELPDRIESSATCDTDGQNVFVGCYDGHLYCLDAASGEVRWKFLTGDAIKSSPICVNSSVIFGSHDKKLYCLSAASGTLIWFKTISSGSLFASPTWDRQDRILTASLDGTCAAVQLVTGECIWSFKLDKPVFSSPVCFGESKRCLFACVGGTLNCCDTATGEFLWKFQAQGPIFSTPSVHERRIVFGSHDHVLYCVDSEDGNLVWRVIFSSPVYSSPSVGSFVVCSDTDGLLRIMATDDGKILSEYKLPGETFSSPVVVGFSVLIGCRDDFLYCLQVKDRRN